MACSSHLQRFYRKSSEFAAFFKKALSCEEVYQRVSRRKLSKKEKGKYERRAERCLEENKRELAFLILERLLRNSQRQNVNIIEIKRLEKKLARLSFMAKDYEKALKHFTSLLKKPLEPGEKFFIQYHIAESFFYLEKYSQAMRELEKCFFKGISPKQKKKARLLKGRIFMARQQFDEALLFFQQQIEEFPEEESFFREYLALAYEFKKDFSSAVEELKKIEPSKPFIRKKIENLSSQLKNRQGFSSP